MVLILGFGFVYRFGFVNTWGVSGVENFSENETDRDFQVFQAYYQDTILSDVSPSTM
jgi:hypothetical protein